MENPTKSPLQEKIEKEFDSPWKEVTIQIRQDLDAVEASLRGATSGTEPIQEGGLEKLREVARILRETKNFLDVL